MRQLFKNGTVVDAKMSRPQKLDILVEGSQIVEIGYDLDTAGRQVIDCADLFIMPGLIDMHCHLREPGATDSETIASGARSAVRGGYTTICPMPNTSPTIDNLESLNYVHTHALAADLCHIFPYSSVTVGEKGTKLVNFALQRAGGAIAFSDDGHPIKNPRLLLSAMLEANRLGTFVAEHCEDPAFADGAINAGAVADYLGAKGIETEAEVLMAVRDITLAALHHAHIHLCHISTAPALEIIARAKHSSSLSGFTVTCETCPHYFSLTEDEVLESGTNAKMNPPLRSETDRQAVIKALREHVIDCIVTDHAPHTAEKKAQGLNWAPNGIIGFETALPAALTNLYQPRHLQLTDLARLMSLRPAELLDLHDRGQIAPGFMSDLTIFDLRPTYTYTEDMIVSKSKNTPWLGKQLTGKVVYTVVEGNVIDVARL